MKQNLCIFVLFIGGVECTELHSIFKVDSVNQHMHFSYVLGKWDRISWVSTMIFILWAGVQELAAGVSQCGATVCCGLSSAAGQVLGPGHL